ncbi:MAG: FkbM family methyltransferase, partial [Thaumarchaeota archaeon]|nr:FkbM family methyltransferase [Nitrososphaerota archaeon]
MTKYSEKIRILIKAIKMIKNWHMYVFVYLGWIKSQHVILKTRSGLKIRLRVNSTDLMAFTHVWLLREYEKPGFEIHSNDTIIDIGSHIGLFTLFASQFCRDGRIFCFEPVKENYDMLLFNLQLNNIINVKPFNSAVSEKKGEVKIHLNDDESGHSMFISGTKFIQIQSTSLKDIIDSNNLEKCDCVKMDCEGAEYDIIDSLPEDYFNKIKKMCIEYHFIDEKQHMIE